MEQKALWYVVHVHSGSERKVAAAIREQAEKKGMLDCFPEIIVASEEVIEVRRGKKMNLERNFMPGYVLLKMVLTDEAWHLVRNVPKVTGFLGSKGRPSPVSEVEAMRMVRQAQEGGKAKEPTMHFEIGEQVRVCDGPFTSFTGMVDAVDEEKSRLKVMVSIFGRSTPVDLEYTQVEKI